MLENLVEELLVVCHVSIFGYGHLNLVDASCAANCQTPTPRARKLRCDETLVLVGDMDVAFPYSWH